MRRKTEKMMRSKNNHLTCLAFTETQLQIGVYNVASDSLIQRFILPLPPQIEIKANGAFKDPFQCSQQLVLIFEEYHLPAKVIIGIPLKYLDLKRLSLPDMPMGDLKQIIIDEASRESIFGLSGDPVAVAYRILDDPDAREKAMKGIITATVDQEVIDSYLTAMNHSSNELVSIKPLLEGLQEILRNDTAKQRDAAAYVKPGQEESEFYIWQNGTFTFWRPLMVGHTQLERFQNEILVSLEHFQRRATMVAPIRTIFFISQPLSITLEELKVDFIAPDRWDDLKGLGRSALSVSFDFLEQGKIPFQPTAHSKTHRLLMATLFCTLTVMNIGMLFLAYQSWSEAKQYQERLQQKQALFETVGTQITEQKQAKLQKTKTRLNFVYLLDSLRQSVPEDLRFERVDYHAGTHVLHIEGYCFLQESVNRFLRQLKPEQIFYKITAVEVNRLDRNGNEIIHFKLNLQTEVSDDGR